MFHYELEHFLIWDSMCLRVYQPANMVKSRGKLSYHKGLRTNQAVQPPKSFKSQSSKSAAHRAFQIPSIGFAEPELH